LDDPHDLRAYRQRWTAIEAVEEEEARTASYELRFRQLNALYRLGCELGILPLQDREEEVVRQRWIFLKKDSE
jgi:hypothetical protein